MPRKKKEPLKDVTILRMMEVKKRTGLSRSSIYRKMSLGDFPVPINLGIRSIGWIEAEIDEWINEKVVQRDEQ